MSPKPPNSTAAFTRTELLIVTSIVAIVAAFVFVGVSRVKQVNERLSCADSLRAMQSSYWIWGNDDHGDLFPAATATTNGGWNNRLSTANAGAFCWTNYTILQNELGQSARVLICPADNRTPATNFIGRGSSDDHGDGDFDNTKISYFVGVQANRTDPRSILMGDRNIGPGTLPDSDYGYSPANGAGNDVTIDSPVCWSLKMHSNGKSAGAGNVLHTDGSVQRINSPELWDKCLKLALANTKTNAGPNNEAGIRLIFP